ncbi:unnamed protein product [Meganyctiphanes norvegica]|uniref:Uncharacterized protein n=1 Tax=Meganyctiphanes norvegica TaxID=48144 RepID=A0AAV2R454_MEGNR
MSGVDFAHGTKPLEHRRLLKTTSDVLSNNKQHGEQLCQAVILFSLELNHGLKYYTYNYVNEPVCTLGIMEQHRTWSQLVQAQPCTFLDVNGKSLELHRPTCGHQYYMQLYIEN